MPPIPPTNTENNPLAHRHLPALLLLFIGSGCAALIYEIVWYQMLQLVIGQTSLSLGLLLGSFMGGMCLGSFLLPRYIAKGRHPLKVYAVLELGIGAIGLLVLWLMPAVTELYTGMHITVNGSMSVILRATLGAVCLLPPTILMGATLPAISRWISTTPRGVSWMGFFYGGNIAGAVFGCLLAGFYLLRLYNMASATYVAVAINVTVAMLALSLASDSSKAEIAAAESANKERTITAPGAWAIYTAIGLSGLSALGAEVIWTRLLSLLFGGTVYTFSIILAVFLVGLGLGSGLGSMLARTIARPRLALGMCQLLLALGIAWAAYMISYSLPYWPIDPTLSAASPWFNFQLDLARTFWTILPPTLLWGMSFPLALASVAAPGQDPAKLVGGVYAANTVGAIIGALSFSLLFVPGVGTQSSEKILIAIAGLATLVTLGPLLAQTVEKTAGAIPLPRPVLGIAALLVAAVVLTPLLAFSVGAPFWGAIAYGRMEATYGKNLIPGITTEKAVPQNDGTSDIYCLYAGEGLNGSVAVTYSTAGVRSFHSAGKVQASNDPSDMRLQRLLGHISALSVKDPKDVLVVACGAGVTAGSFLLHPTIEHITICDIEPLVPTMVTPMFTKENYGIVDHIKERNPDTVHDKSVQVVYDDGRHFIRTTQEKYDIISSDPIDPWVKGCAAMNTVEYYQMCKDHLKPGGVMTLWIPFYESNIPTIKSVITTFFKVFPNGVLFSNDFNGAGYDAVLFGQVGPDPAKPDEPVQLDLDAAQARLDSASYAEVKQSLSEYTFGTAADVYGTYAGRAQDMGEWMDANLINTDRDLRLQYLAGLALNNYNATNLLTDITRYYKYPDDLFTGTVAHKLSLKQAIEIPRHLNAPVVTSLAAPVPPAGP